MSEHKFTNALAQETSPYLLQHAHNPVQWHPWSAEALRRAREEDKPILLSIGYSACHWCHVMERESFEDETIARIMNQHFINIKVDREERPDLDSIYMSAIQMMTGSGGWPLTVFLTPDGVPFYGGTYFPPEERHGMPGFPRVLLSVAGAYHEKRDLIRKDAARVIEELLKADSFGSTQGALSDHILDSAVAKLIAGYDAQHGGFGSAPKFPAAMALTFLLRSHLRSGQAAPLEIVEHTLEKMALGGIYDQLGGGFHRYSVDPNWLVPHFEKMLYDNALLSRIYLDTYLLTKNNFYRRITEETLDYVRREMTSPEGGFYSTQDADSEGQEGRLFIWTPDEVKAALGETEGDVLCRYYDVTPSGNFEGKNILSVPRNADSVARLSRLPVEELWVIIQRGRKRLLEVRNKRIKPARDEKVLTAWNGMTLRSFAEAAGALDRADYRETAVRNAEFILSRLRRNGRLLRSWKDGQARLSGYIDDYACLIDGLLSLYEATFDSRWVVEAGGLAAVLVDDFWDSREGNFYFTAKDHEALIHRPKEFYDSATPSGNSVAASALLRLAALSGEPRWAQFSQSILSGVADAMAGHPAGFSNFLSALDLLLAGPREIAIIGNPSESQTRALLRQVYDFYLPNKVLACGNRGSMHLLSGRSQIDGQPTAYVCHNNMCGAPVTTVEGLRAQLMAKRESA